MENYDIKQVACMGAGIIGSGWATNFALRGYEVYMYRRNAKAFKETKNTITNNLDFFASKGILTNKEVKESEQRITYTTNIEEAVQDVQYIQESSPESYRVKQELLAEIEKYAPADTIVASSTSGLLITEIAKYAEYPERCIGAHPYNPVHIIPLVEITKGEKTSSEVIKHAYDFMLKLRKEPVILNKEALGFISNRLQMAVYREVMDIVMNGVCSVEDIDKALVFGPGLRLSILGQVLNMHLGGGEGGVRSMHKHLNDSATMWLEDMARWTRIPEEWPEMAHEGVLKEMENRLPEFGKTPTEIAQFRDDALIEILKLHKKL